ncbi:MAG: hypothetical protein GXP27_03195 [Planctomycetes bacterium]|nr:hypothetical protein [Planctomycetota bacterium]
MSYAFCWLVALSVASQPKFGMWVSDQPAGDKLPPSIGRRLKPVELWKLANGDPTPPYLSVTAGVRLEDGTVWLGSRQGLMRLSPGARHWRLFHSRRWLPNDHIQDLAVTKNGEVWVKTPSGVGRVFQRIVSLEEKIAMVHAALRKRHVRFGLVGSIRLNKPGQLDAGWFQPDNDNDGLWTSLYVAAESFRFATTGDPKARQNAWQSLKALMFLEEITGQPGFVARSIVPIEISKEGEFPWEKSADGKWWWKGDTSSDELDGHFFAYSIYYDLAATDEQKEQIRAVVGRIMDHILDNGYYYLDPHGRRTKWGMWAPEQLNRNPEWINERGLNSLEILSHLKVSAHITGRKRYRQAARELIEKHGYAINTIRQKMIAPYDEETNHSDDELAFVAYYPLLRYERDPELRRIYLLSLQRSWLVERPEASPLFNFIYAAGLQADAWPHADKRPPEPFLAPTEYDRDVCRQWFQDVPADTIRWTIVNSNRCDLGRVYLGRHGKLCSTRLLPISERRVMKWNGNPYQLDGGNGGRDRDDGTFILLPYWMGRYHRLIAE